MKKGSALLVVLGMMAFIMVSALAFSAYMRAARLPSSYLRRTASSRQLVKAGLARAINEIDLAIGNDPHPGVGSGSRNVWRHRVFFAGPDEASIDSTVSPLCLEALAYIPPPLVNEARYFSRLSPTAGWKSLAFDVGRYSYCALDVSDYFDVNRSMADVHRASSPQGRISLGYLFENDGHTSQGSGAGAWDQFLNQYRNFDADSCTVDFQGQNPLISLADFNLALGRKGSVGEMKSPWYEYLAGGSGSGFYHISGEADEDRILRMTFVTDGLFPTSDKVDEEDVDEEDADIERHDLNDGFNQPFARDFLLQERPALSDAVLGKRLNNDAQMKWLEHLSGLGCAALYDYLDPDHVPISLAVPTTERVPMICGIEPLVPGSRFAVKKTTDPVNPEEPRVVKNDDVSREVEVKVSYKLDGGELTKGFIAGRISSLAVFPFAHPDEKDDSSFTVDGKVSLFFSSEETKLRTGNSSDVLHLQSKDVGSTEILAGKGVINVKLGSQAVAFNGRIEDEAGAVKSLDRLTLSEGTALAPQLAMEDNALLTVTYHWTQTKDTTGGVIQGAWTPGFEEVRNKGGEYISAVHCGIPAIKNGNVDNAFSDGALLSTLKGGNDSGLPMILNAAVWLRVLNANGKVVDMVPACLKDDKTQNDVNDPDPRMDIIGTQEFGGAAYPLMRFDTGVSFTLSINGLEALAGDEPKEIKFDPEAAVVADPRYNYAPEHWYRQSGTLTPQSWLTAIAPYLGGDRDGDIFMATSDAGYMQSPFEAAHLPRFTNLIKFGNSVSSGNYRKPDMTAVTKLGTAPAANADMMWRTFDPFDEDEYAFNILPWTSEGSSFKVNPYSDSTNVMMAVFANTPVDWKRASTNAMEGAVDYWAMDASTFNGKYAMNEYTSDTQLGWHDLERVAGTFMDEVHRNNGTWKDAWASLAWPYDRNNPERFVATSPLNDSDTLWTHDRKFLYGFWRDCFAAKQQLFLVFVRAEPMMMGSGAVGQIPPQLGARAVALVWRDPKRTRDSDVPHRTRVLFYRQFE